MQRSSPWQTLVADGVDYTGLLVWQASTVLAHFIGARSDIFANKSCIELGSGAGLTGLFCAQFARKTIMTDRNDDGKCSVAARALTLLVLDLLRANIERNGLSPEQCSVASLDWGEPLLDDVAKGAPYEVVLASDVMCEPEMKCPCSLLQLPRPHRGDRGSLVQVSRKSDGPVDSVRCQLCSQGQQRHSAHLRCGRGVQTQMHRGAHEGLHARTASPRRQDVYVRTHHLKEPAHSEDIFPHRSAKGAARLASEAEALRHGENGHLHHLVHALQALCYRHALLAGERRLLGGEFAVGTQELALDEVCGGRKYKTGTQHNDK